MQKDLIKQRFKKSLKTYEKCAVVQKDMAEKLSKKIERKSYKNILELGCGTGFLTREISKTHPFKTYDAVDIVDNCRPFIKNINPEINFICYDIENFIPHKKYDLVISNASLQWVDNLSEFIQKLKPAIIDNFAFTLFGTNNFKEMTPFIKSQLKYYTKSELETIFNDFEILDITEETQILEFDTPINVLHHIRNTGVNALSKTTWTKSDLNNFINTYPQNNNNKYSLTYHPIYITLKNKK